MDGLTVVFRCDASPSIGGGHVVRCLALAEELLRGAHRVHFAVSEETPGTVAELSERFPDFLTGMTGLTGDLDRIARRWPNPDLFVIDHYGLDRDFELAATKLAPRLLVLDDFPVRPHACTHLLDTTLGRDPAEYEGLVPAGATLMCGSRYALLRQPFRQLRSLAEDRPRTNREPLAVLVAMGMTDNHDATTLVLKGLEPLLGKIRIDVVLGSRAPQADAIRERLTGLGPHARFHVDADAEAMARLTAGADLVIGAPGSASYERCCLGRPAMLIVVAENQRSNAAALAAAGAARVLGDLPSISSLDVRRAVAACLDDPSTLVAMSRAAAGIADGCGAGRVVRDVLGSHPYCGKFV